ncbi:AMP-binding protein [Amycolatopsis sp. w19]|uniref:AMP-binding protein n=1 Tax=Amycolatopsis sp. w19 TaxID=3448134 RepID=UPI003F1C7882
MRDDVVQASSILGHSPGQVWEVIGDPESYSRFVAEISWCEIQRPAERGRGPKCLVRLEPRPGTLVVGEIEARVWRPGEHVVWCGVENDGIWVSVELRQPPDGGTELLAQLMLPAPHSPLVSAASFKRTVRAAARRIDLHLSGRAASPQDEPAHTKATTLHTASTLIKAGVLAAARPDKIARQLTSLSQWGATVAGGYSANAARVPEEVALHDERNVRTFKQTADRSNQLANALAARGVRARDRIALLCRNHATMVESLIACSKLGVDAILLNTGLSAGAVADVIGLHKPVAVLADDEFSRIIADIPGDFLRLSTWPETENGYPTIDQFIAGVPATKLKPVDRIGRLVVLTSGTTGTPKGARRPTPKGLSTSAAMLDRIPLHSGDRFVVAAPLFHSWGLAGMQIGMAVRASLSLIRRFDAEEILRTIAEHRCGVLFAVPIMLQRILDLPERIRSRYDLSSLRIVASSGSALPGTIVTEFMDTFGDVLYNFYGSTEVSWASIATPEDLRAAPTTAGRCPPGTRVAILDDDHKRVPPGWEGQIFVGNDMLFEGYTDGASVPRAENLMATGDVGYQDAAGRLFVTGRADEMIVSGGENVSPRPVEEAIVALPGVHEAAVIGVPDREFGQRFAAYIVPKRGARMSADDVRAYIHHRLARFAVPRDVYFVEELPRNATGKVLKRLLRDETWPIEQ